MVNIYLLENILVHFILDFFSAFLNNKKMCLFSSFLQNFYLFLFFFFTSTSHLWPQSRKIKMNKEKSRKIPRHTKRVINARCLFKSAFEIKMHIMFFIVLFSDLALALFFLLCFLGRYLP